MNNQEIIKKTEDYVRKTLQGEGSGHDWWHIYRVWNNAKHIIKSEKADYFVVELAALLHDISDWKFNGGDDLAGPRIAKEWLEGLNVDKTTIEHVCNIIASISFKGAKTKSETLTIEGKIVQDSDRLDGIGSIGIARAFATGAKFNEVFYDPDIKSQEYTTADKYKKSKGQKGHTVINHFYEKLLLLKDLMNTKSAKKIATERHQYMLDFLDRFYKEWSGKL